MYYDDTEQIRTHRYRAKGVLTIQIPIDAVFDYDYIHSFEDGEPTLNLEKLLEYVFHRIDDADLIEEDCKIVDYEEDFRKSYNYWI